MLTFSITQQDSKKMNETVMSGRLTAKRPTTDWGRKWWSEALIKSLHGRLGDEVNVDAYGYICEQNTLKALVKREVALITDADIENGVRGVSDKVACYIERNIDTIIQSSEVETLVWEFKQMQDQLQIEEGVNFWRIFSLARQESTRAIAMLKDLTTRIQGVSDLVRSVLLNESCLSALEGEFKC